MILSVHDFSYLDTRLIIGYDLIYLDVRIDFKFVESTIKSSVLVSSFTGYLQRKCSNPDFSEALF